MDASIGAEPNHGRCPVCLSAVRLPDSLAPGQCVRCPSCNSPFDPEMLLPPPEDSSTRDTPPAEATATSGFSGNAHLFAAVLCVPIVAVVSASAESMKGPEFITLYLVTFFALFLGAWTVRRTWRDLWAITIWAFFTFEAIGAIRLVTGYLAGMHKFGYTITAMTVGGLLFFVRARGDGGYGIAGTCAGGCSGFTTCGGGGGCGSGCGGGCGGCGG